MSDVMIHVCEDLSEKQRDVVLEDILEIEGVLEARNRDKTSHLTLIHYDPQIAQSAELLNNVRDKGLHASLVGF